jgi:hypothetical protein
MSVNLSNSQRHLTERDVRPRTSGNPVLAAFQTAILPLNWDGSKREAGVQAVAGREDPRKSGRGNLIV